MSVNSSVTVALADYTTALSYPFPWVPLVLRKGGVRAAAM
jgi:hypothetical protein